MSTIPNAFVPGTRVLLGPGPSEVPPRILQSMATPLVGHLDPEFLRLMTETQTMLRQVFRTNNPMTFTVSGTGSAGMETCIVNLLEAGDRFVACVNGVFGGRMVDVARRAGADVLAIERPWGETFELDEIESALRKHRPKAIGIVHAETSTGAWQPIDQLSRLCRAFDTLLVVDCVTSLGGLPVEIDQWGIDAAYSGTQKCLSAPPGLAPVTFNQRAVDAIAKRKTKVQSWYFDTTMLASYWGQDRAYHHTAPITMNYAFHEALRMVLEEGLEARWARHRRNHLALKAGLSAIGIAYTAQDGRQLPTLNAVKVPDGVDDTWVRKELLARFGIEIGGGLGAFKGKVWRIGLMGYGSRPANVYLVLSALEQLLREAGQKCNLGASIAATNVAYASNL